MKLGVIKSLKPMLSLLLPNDDLREQVYDYIPLLLAEYQGSLEALFITQVRARRATAPASQGSVWAHVHYKAVAHLQMRCSPWL